MGYLEKLIKGTLLYGYLYYNAPSSQKFTKLDVFLDTPIVLGLLGYKGDEIQTYNRELIMLLKEEGANLKVFVETINEIERVLLACKAELANQKMSTSSRHDVMQVFLNKGFTPAHIERELVNLNTKITQMGIKVEKFPPHNKTIEPSEARLQEILNESIHYTNEEALIHDVSCITAICRLRGGLQRNTIENSGAIFMTNNVKVVHASYKWWKEIEKKRGVPPVILSEMIAAIAWVKQPLKAPNLPKLAVIADCYEMLNPPDLLWDKYLHAIEQLKQRGELKEDEVLLLRYSAEAHHALMEKTFGNYARLTVGSIPEILEKAKIELLKKERRRTLEIQQELDRIKREKEKEQKGKLEKEKELEEVRKKIFKNLYRIGFGIGIFSLWCNLDNKIFA